MPKPFVYFGTPYVARDTLVRLCDAGYVPSLVVTSPDAPKGRGLALTPSPTKEEAELRGIPVFAPEKLTSEAIEEIMSGGYEYGVVVAYGKILPEVLINRFPKGLYNIHYSLLPKYRGAAPVEAALLASDAETGVAVQRMVYALDAGPIAGVAIEQIREDDTTTSLRARLIERGADLLIELLPSIEDGSISLTEQDESEATHMGKIQKCEGELRVPGNDALNWAKYRAYIESPGTYFFTERGGRTIRVKIVSARFERGSFVIERVIPEGKKEMSYEDFMRSA